jgi:hypothetical protein
VVFWVSASLDVPTREVPRETSFWTEVNGATLPRHLVVREADGPAGVHVDLHDDERVPVVPEPASFPGVRRSRVYQVSLDIPGPLFDAEAARWARLTGGRVEVLGRRPEFAWLRIPGGPRPLDVLLQRLDRHDGQVSAHLDVGTPDRADEVRRHRALGATLLAEEEFWTVLADPAGLPYCVTDRDPATGELP